MSTPRACSRRTTAASSWASGRATSGTAATCGARPPGGLTSGTPMSASRGKRHRVRGRFPALRTARAHRGRGSARRSRRIGTRPVHPRGAPSSRGRRATSQEKPHTGRPRPVNATYARGWACFERRPSTTTQLRPRGHKRRARSGPVAQAARRGPAAVESAAGGPPRTRGPTGRCGPRGGCGPPPRAAAAARGSAAVALHVRREAFDSLIAGSICCHMLP